MPNSSHSERLKKSFEYTKSDFLPIQNLLSVVDWEQSKYSFNNPHKNRLWIYALTIVRAVQSDYLVCLARVSSFWKLRKFLRMQWANKFSCYSESGKLTPSAWQRQPTFPIHAFYGLPRQSYDYLGFWQVGRLNAVKLLNHSINL